MQIPIVIPTKIFWLINQLSSGIRNQIHRKRHIIIPNSNIPTKLLYRALFSHAFSPRFFSHVTGIAAILEKHIINIIKILKKMKFNHSMSNFNHNHRR